MLDLKKKIPRRFCSEIFDQLQNMKKGKQYSDLEYSARLLFIKDLMNKRLLNSLQNGKRFIRYTHGTEYTFIIILLLIPVIYYFHTLLPRDQSVIDFYVFSVSDNGFKSPRVYIWFLAGKISIIIPLIIWFYTSKPWHKYAIMSPLILYTYQFWEANLDVNHLDSYGNLMVFPLVLVVILIVIISSHVFKYRYGILDMYEDLHKELELSIDKAAKGSIRNLQIKRDLQSRDFALNSWEESKYLEYLTDLRKKIVLQLGTER